MVPIYNNIIVDMQIAKSNSQDMSNQSSLKKLDGRNI